MAMSPALVFPGIARTGDVSGFIIVTRVPGPIHAWYCTVCIGIEPHLGIGGQARENGPLMFDVCKVGCRRSDGTGTAYCKDGTGAYQLPRYCTRYQVCAYNALKPFSSTF